MTTTLRKTFAGVATAAAVLAMSACGGSASEDDVRDKLEDVYKSTAGLNDDQAEQLADCMAPKLKDGLSDDGLDALMDSDTDDVAAGGGEKVDADDQKVLTDAATECSSKIGG